MADAATFNAQLQAERRRADRAEEARENANEATLRAERQLRDLRDWAESQANSYNAAPPSLANAGQERAYRDVVLRIEEDQPVKHEHGLSLERIESIVDRYAADEIDASSLETWLARETWELTSASVVGSCAYCCLRLVSEMQNGDWTEVQLKERLYRALASHRAEKGGRAHREAERFRRLDPETSP